MGSIIIVVGQVIIIHPPIIHIGDQQSISNFTSSIFSAKKSTVISKSSTAYYPVSAYLDDDALIVTFTESVGLANVMVYDANNQLVDMVTVDTSIDFEAVLATNTWASGSYKLVITYSSTTLQGIFDF